MGEVSQGTEVAEEAHVGTATLGFPAVDHEWTNLEWANLER